VAQVVAAPEQERQDHDLGHPLREQSGQRLPGRRFGHGHEGDVGLDAGAQESDTLEQRVEAGQSGGVAGAVGDGEDRHVRAGRRQHAGRRGQPAGAPVAEGRQ
jgi:hypothetical protein